MSEPVSIHTVAKKAHCSIATVSNVLNRKGRVGEKTRRKVLATVEALGYVANSAGRNLRINRSETIGLLFYPSCAEIFQNTFYAEITAGLEEHLTQAGYHLLLASYEASVAHTTVPDFLVRGKVDGMILLGAFPKKIIRRFCVTETPLLLLDANVELPVDSVVTDGLAAGEAIVDHLVALGHRRFVWIGYTYEDDNIRLRKQGFLDALRRRNLPDVDRTSIEGVNENDEFYRQIKIRLRGKRPPTAVVAVNDGLAVAMMQRLREDGYQVPEQVSVVGYDDDLFVERVKPLLSTVRVDKKTLGRVGAEMILRRVADPEIPVEKRLLPVELVWRESVGPAHSI
ncbi:MAG: hypothetical protein B9S32_04460 [Verrucomicrobia bacterium Tous-C9LFEB]|nr:MAG: hypothetical protein B9S32_04460 [Verrucomicrobia bacterium Tous-C9LFEB]